MAGSQKTDKKDVGSVLKYNESEIFKRNNAPVADSSIEAVRCLLLATNSGAHSRNLQENWEKTVLDRESLQYFYLTYKKGVLTEKLENDRAAAEKADQKRIAEPEKPEKQGIRTHTLLNLDATVSNESDVNLLLH